MQEDFDEVMKTYPESFKAMDLVAEHRLRALHRSSAWELRQNLPDAAPHLGSKIEQILQVTSAWLIVPPIPPIPESVVM